MEDEKKGIERDMLKKLRLVSPRTKSESQINNDYRRVLTRMKLKKYLIIVLICVLGCMMLMTGCGKNDSKKEPEGKTITVTDSASRIVELPQPLEKAVILGGGAVEAVCILKAQDKLIGVSDFTQKNPYLCMQDKESVGSDYTPNYEKIMELRPQVVVSTVSHGIGPEVAEKLEPLGVKIVLLDLYKPGTYDTELKTLAKMFGKEKEANSYLKWKTEKIAIMDKVKDLKTEQKVKVFTMYTSSFEQGKWQTSGSSSATHQAIEMAGGINVARELKESVVSPEWILQQNSEALVFRDARSDKYLGYTVLDFDNAEKIKEQAIKNPVLSKTDAVQKDRIYFFPEDILGGSKSYLGALYLAKWFYPDLFKDLDPEKQLKEYFEKWLGVPFQGKWTYPPVSNW